MIEEYIFTRLLSKTGKPIRRPHKRWNLKKEVAMEKGEDSVCFSADTTVTVIATPQTAKEMAGKAWSITEESIIG